METVWVVGQYKKEVGDGFAWELAGVFSTREKALKACSDRDFFLGPVEFDMILPTDKIEWPGCEYPMGIFESKEDFENWKNKPAFAELAK